MRIASKNRLDVVVTSLYAHLDEQPPRLEWIVNNAIAFNYTGLGGPVDRAAFDLYSGPTTPPAGEPASADELSQWGVSFVCGLYMAGMADTSGDSPDVGLAPTDEMVDRCLTTHVAHDIPATAAGDVDTLLFGQGVTVNAYSARVAHVRNMPPLSKTREICLDSHQEFNVGVECAPLGDDGCVNFRDDFRVCEGDNYCENVSVFALLCVGFPVGSSTVTVAVI